MTFDAAQHPHRRFDPLSGAWVLVSPHRARRPWLGQQAEPDRADRPAYDSACYLCPGNVRASGAQNPHYDGPFVFANDFAAVAPDTPPVGDEGSDGLFRMATARGEARVICFSPDHGKSLPELGLAGVERVVECWCDQAAELGTTHAHVQIFENKGEMMGCSNPHPHGQVWATDHVPDTVRVEAERQSAWLARTGRPMLLQLAESEAGGPRAVVETAHWLALVPWWAQWPFELLLLPRFAVSRLPDLDPEQRSDLARAVRELTTRYDNLFAASFPYSMGWHAAPGGGGDHRGFQLHAHFYPPLLRSASVRKFMVGYEMLAEAQRDLTPEQAAERLRAQSRVHYRA